MHAVYYNAAFHTLSETRPLAEAVAVSGGRIIAVGRARELLAAAPAGAMLVDLGGRCVIPGLTDAHAHFLGYAEKSAWIELRETRSIEEVIERVSIRAPRSGHDWVLGRGWDQNDWPEPAYPGREALDAAAARSPAYLVRVCGHAAWVNSAALRLAGVDRDTPDPPGGRIMRDSSGEPTGILIDNAMDLVSKLVPPFSRDEKKRLLREAAERCLAAGLVGVHEMGVTLQTVQLYRELYAAGDLPFRVSVYLEGTGANAAALADGLRPEPLAEFFSIAGVKFYADGSLGARSAALLEDYADDPGNRGILLETPKGLYDALLPWHEAGFQAAVHAIGDAAVRMVLDVYERIQREHPAPPRRHRIEHAQVVSPADRARFGSIGVVPSMQFAHCTSDMPWAGLRLGARREADAYAWRSLMSACGRIPGGSDFPVEPIDPLIGIHAAVTRTDLSGNPTGGWHPEERLSVHEAVRAFTVDAAWAAHREDLTGVIEPGMLADFVVLSEDIFSIDPSAIPRIRVLATVLGGEILYRAPEF